MTNGEKRGYLYSAISFCINPIFGLLQAAANFAYGRWEQDQQGLHTIAPEYYVKDLGIAVQTKVLYDGQVEISSKSINVGRGSAQFPIKADKELVYAAVSDGSWTPIHPTRFRA